MCGEDLQKMILEEADYPVALSVPDSWKTRLLQPSKGVLLVTFACIEEAMLAKMAVRPLMHRSFL